MRVLVTGATGYIGGRLVPRLVEGGHAVRVLARDPSRLAGRPWRARVEVARGDVLDLAVDAACHLVHGMALLAPRGPGGHLYGYAPSPIPRAIFANLGRGVAERAASLPATEATA